jgi:tetratricopeptide (TPR) repeat protein
MKSQFRSILFALVALPAAACGGDRPPTQTVAAESPSVPAAVTEQPKALPPVAAIEPVKVEAPAPVTKYSDAMEQGKVLAAKGDTARAREMFESAVKLDKKKAEPHIELARLFVGMNERGLAIKEANKAVKLAPESSQAFNTLGRAELLRFNYDNAIIAFRQATELNPDNVWAWNNLGLCQLQLKHYQEAADALAEATSRNGSEPYMWNNLGTAYEQLDQLDEARTAFEKGGTLGSKEALASRKRLEGVKSIAIAKASDDKVDVKPETKSDSKTYETQEPMVEEPKAEEPKVEEPKADDKSTM